MTRGVDEAADYWRAVVEAAGLGVWDYNTVTGEKRYSPRWREIRHLLPGDPLPATDEEWLASVHPEDVAIARHYTDLINCGHADEVSFEYRERGETGHWVWIMCRGRALRRDESGRATRFVGVDTDITALKAAEQDRALNAKQLEIAVTMAGIGIWKFDITSQAITWDARLRAIYGVPADLDPLPRDIWERSIHPDDLDNVLSATSDALQRKLDYMLEFRIVRPDGEIRHIRSNVSFLTDSLNGPGVIGVNWDVTDDRTQAFRLAQLNMIAAERLAELTRTQEELERRSRHDPLTGLPNRRAVDECLERIASRSRGLAGSAFMLIDIDQFKAVNDTHGHAFGDRMLQEVAQALNGQISQWGLLARTGGDEFLAIIDTQLPPDSLTNIAAAAVTGVRDASRALGHEISVSIGIDATADPRATRDEVFARADKAMYRAKQSGGARALWF